MPGSSDTESSPSRPPTTLHEVETTATVRIPTDPLERVIGQDRATELARVAAFQRRHLLLVGPPGIGKSMTAQALALHLPRPQQEVRIVQNPENPERPSVLVVPRDEVLHNRERTRTLEGELIKPQDAPAHVAERLGYRCPRCSFFSLPTDRTCPSCQALKQYMPSGSSGNPFRDILGGIQEVIVAGGSGLSDSVRTTRLHDGVEEVVAYERAGERIRVLDQRTLENRRQLQRESPSKVVAKLERNPFVMATGASETELLGDVRHDPYGGHPQLGSPPYERVIPGAVHEAHEGVLFIDELPHLGHLQRFILTAMQERRFPITGRNPQSGGASVRVDSVPCDFILVAACNIQDVHKILAPLRSRIAGGGYELLLETSMPDTERNQMRLVQFCAQEIVTDGRIPHATGETVLEFIAEARRRAEQIDGAKHALTLRLREMGGLLRAAGDIATATHSPLIEPSHLREAVKRTRPIEDQIREKYGSYQGGLRSDSTDAQRESMGYYYWNQNPEGGGGGSPSPYG